MNAACASEPSPCGLRPLEGERRPNHSDHVFKTEERVSATINNSNRSWKGDFQKSLLQNGLSEVIFSCAGRGGRLVRPGRSWSRRPG